MEAGDEIVYLREPLLFGVGVIHHVTSRGQLIVEFPNSNRESFQPHELELAEVWAKRDAA